MNSNPIRVTSWGEYRHERIHEAVTRVYPDGIHTAIARHLSEQGGIDAHTAALDDHEHGLDEHSLAETDVLIWWGHMAHHEVRDEVVDRVQRRVLEGMGLIVLHSGAQSKLFRRLMGTTGDLKWRDIGEKERIWIVEPGHPIADGLNEYFELEHEEMYGEPFDIP